MTTPGFFIVEDTLSPMLAVAGEEMMREVEAIMLEIASDVLDYAKDNAPWADRTGDARNGLDVEVDEEDDVVYLTLFHTVDYGLWLEVIQSGRFATIMPTLEHYAAEVMAKTSSVPSGGEDLGSYE